MRCLGFTFLVSLLLSVGAIAQELDLAGQTEWYRWNARRIGIYAEEIANNRDRGFSGPLRVEIIATENQPTGGDFTGGFVIGSLGLRELRGGSYYSDIDYLVRYNAPPPGFYFTSIALTELTELGWQVADYEDFPGVVNFGGVGFGEAVSDEPHSSIFFAGNVSWESAYGRVQISADEIVNEGPRRSGMLRMRLWATTSVYTGAFLEGYPLATKPLGKLKSGFAFQSYSRPARFRAPPEGWYYITLVLEERLPSGWFVRDWVNFPDQSLF